MPRSGQIIPKYQFPHNETFINDYTQVTDLPPNASGETNTLHVFMSPKGRDGIIQTIRNGAEGFLSEYGNGSFFEYGQPLMNAYACATSGAATLHCLRVTAPNARYANIHIYAKYKIQDSDKVIGKNDDGSDVFQKELLVRFYTKSTTELGDLSLLGDYGLDLMEDLVDGDPDDDGFIHKLMFSVACKGKGLYGNAYRVRLTTLTSYDKTEYYSDYKNYMLEIFQDGSSYERIGEHPVIFNPDAIIYEISMFIDDVINDPDSGSPFVSVIANMDGIHDIFDAYLEVHPDTELTELTFDPFLGINMLTDEEIENYVIDTSEEGSYALNKLDGIPLMNGNEGDFDMSTPTAKRRLAIEEAYINAWSGITDPTIKSRKRIPTNLILDANYQIEIKKLMATLCRTRTDCVGIFDCGTNLISKTSPLDYQNGFGEFVSEWYHAVDAIYGKVKDPFSKKIVTVTDTYWLASAYPIIFQRNNGKHVPLAGSQLGIITGFVKNSIKPIYDEDIDADIMQKLDDKRINIAVLTAKGDVARLTQSTRQKARSDLSELNMVFVLLDIKRDCENLCALYQYEFSEDRELARFNKDAEVLLSSYNEAQVRKINATFTKSEYEAARNILHMNTSVVNKDLVKTTLIEIDVNAG